MLISAVSRSFDGAIAVNELHYLMTPLRIAQFREMAKTTLENVRDLGSGILPEYETDRHLDLYAEYWGEGYSDLVLNVASDFSCCSDPQRGTPKTVIDAEVKQTSPLMRITIDYDDFDKRMRAESLRDSPYEQCSISDWLLSNMSMRAQLEKYTEKLNNVLYGKYGISRRTEYNILKVLYGSNSVFPDMSIFFDDVWFAQVSDWRHENISENHKDSLSIVLDLGLKALELIGAQVGVDLETAKMDLIKAVNETVHDSSKEHFRHLVNKAKREQVLGAAVVGDGRLIDIERAYLRLTVDELRELVRQMDNAMTSSWLDGSACGTCAIHIEDARICFMVDSATKDQS